MSRYQRIARLLRAATMLSQEEFAKKSGLSPHLISQIESCRMEPGRSHLQKMARTAGITLSDAEEVLLHLDRRREHRLRQEQGSDESLPALMDGLKSQLSAVYNRLLELPSPTQIPRSEDLLRAESLMERLRSASREVRVSLVRVAEEFQTWALCERVCEESIRQAARDVNSAAAWAQLAQEIAENVRASEEMLKRLRGYAGLHMANVCRIAGNLDTAENALAAAEKLWEAGSDPEGLLDPGRLPDLKACLRRAQRRFDEAIILLDEAVKVSHHPARALTNKGFTLEVMGEYQRAVDTLLLALAMLDNEGDPRLLDILYLNLANNFCHLGQHRNAAELVRKVQPRVAERGDELDLTRILWLQGRIEAGLGRRQEALRLLGEARERFAAAGMSYDVALCLLEEAALLLSEGRTAEVKALAEELAVEFGRQGVHREALAALRLFQEAAQREQATAELARDLLRYLFRARHDQGLRFSPS